MLLIPLLGFLPPSDERVRNTVLAIADELTEEEMVLRYCTDETEDGLNGKEGTFTICSFWLVSALVEIGELERAKMLCGKLLASASSLELLRRGRSIRTAVDTSAIFPRRSPTWPLINAVTAVIRASAHWQRTRSTPLRPGAPRDAPG